VYNVGQVNSRFNTTSQRAHQLKEGGNKTNKQKRHGTEAAVDEEVEGVAVAGVGGSGAVGGQLLEALDGDGAEVAGEGGVLRQHDGALGHKAVNQRLLAAAHGAQTPRNGNALAIDKSAAV
jgi:hypothetical protein